MIKCDCNYLFFVIYNLYNEWGVWLQVQDYVQMCMVYLLDFICILIYNFSNGENLENEVNVCFKLYLMLNDIIFYDYGWYDRYYVGGLGCYYDNLYLGKDNYYCFLDYKDEIIYWGEDGVIGILLCFQFIWDEIL